MSWYNNIDDDVSSFPEFGKCQKINPSFSRRWTFDRYYKLPSAKKFIIVLLQLKWDLIWEAEKRARSIKGIDREAINFCPGINIIASRIKIEMKTYLVN